jgi:hypothetical protein
MPRFKRAAFKKAALCLLACGLFASIPAVALAAPSAEAAMSVSKVEETGDGLVLTVDVAVGTPSEPYASLDFNLVTSDPDNLAIIDLSDGSGDPSLDISFPPGYGKAYHAGQDDPQTGGARYLIGIFSQTAGNNITEATPVCSARLLYKGDEPQSLSVRDMKLVYVDGEGGVAAAPASSEDVVVQVDAGLLADVAEARAPLSDGPGAEGGGIPPYGWAALAVTACLAVALLMARRRLGRRIRED